MKLGSIVLAAGWLVVTAAGYAAAQQTKEQQACINVLNKGFAKVAATQFKVARNCILAYAKDQSVPDPDTCTQASQAVSDAASKVSSKAATTCAPAPSIGPNNANAVTDEASLDTRNLVSAFIGGTLSTGLVKCSDSPATAGCKCQNALLAQAAKLQGAIFKGFNKCKKAGLKASGPDQIVDTAGINDCLTDATKLDPGSTLAGKVAKLKATISKECGAPVTNPLPGSSTCNGMTGDTLADCVNVQTRCYACIMLNVADNLNSFDDCDTFDDGVVNMTCGAG